MAGGFGAKVIEAAVGGMTSVLVVTKPLWAPVALTVTETRHGPVIAADFSPRRRAAAEMLGADVVIDPAVESPHARWEAHRWVRRNGGWVLVEGHWR